MLVYGVVCAGGEAYCVGMANKQPESLGPSPAAGSRSRYDDIVKAFLTRTFRDVPDWDYLTPQEQIVLTADEFAHLKIFLETGECPEIFVPCPCGEHASTNLVTLPDAYCHNHMGWISDYPTVSQVVPDEGAV